jgi:F420H(2)-dependent quinone reductase
MPPLRLLRFANPVVRAVLRSPAHRILSGSLAVLEYEGRRTGTRRAIPVVYAEDGARIVALAAHPERKQWWRTFREAAPAALVVCGQRRAVQGRLVTGAERRAALRAYLAARPRTAGPLRARGTPTDAALDGVPAAVVAFDPSA